MIRCRKLSDFKKESEESKVDNMEEQQMQSGSSSNSPDNKFRAGNISATVWANNVTVEGRPRVIRSVSLEKSFKDSNGNWSKTGSLNSNDIPKAILVMQKAYEYLMLRENSN